MKILSFLAVFFLASVAMAEMDYPDISKSGKLFTVKLVPGDKNVTVNVAGNKTIDLQWDKTGLQAYLILGKTMKPLKVTKGIENFTIDENVPKPSELRLEVTSQGKSESINVPLR